MREALPPTAAFAGITRKYKIFSRKCRSLGYNARHERTKLFWTNRSRFLDQLSFEISAHTRKADKLGIIPCVRLNGTSDVVWEKVAPKVFTDFPQVQFYDYTKLPTRFDHAMPKNYHLTFSQSENNQRDAARLLKSKHNVAVVFRLRKGAALPAKYMGVKVIDGDEHDLRFTDKRGVVVGLRSKGSSYHDQTGFVVDL